MPKKAKIENYTYAVGRRKSAVATVKLFEKSGESQVNKMALAKFFPGESAKIRYGLPFKALEVVDKFHFQAKVLGGGKIGQLDALVLAISRALQKISPTANTPILRSNDLLTVDSRVRQRRMVGKGGKSRRQKQSPKR